MLQQLATDGCRAWLLAPLPPTSPDECNTRGWVRGNFAPVQNCGEGGGVRRVGEHRRAGARPPGAPAVGAPKDRQSRLSRSIQL